MTRRIRSRGYRIQNYIRWTVALLACLWATWEAGTFKSCIMITWLFAHLLSPDQRYAGNAVRWAIKQCRRRGTAIAIVPPAPLVATDVRIVSRVKLR